MEDSILFINVVKLNYTHFFFAIFYILPVYTGMIVEKKGE